MVYRLLSSNIGVSYVGSIVSNEYVVVPCRVLGLGALFGGMLIQSFVIRFNDCFVLPEVLKLIPILCVSFGLIFLLIYAYSQGASVYNISNHENVGNLYEIF